MGWSVKHTGSMPCAQAALWRAEDGTLGIFIVNYVNEEIPFAYSIDPAEYGIKGQRYRITEITPDGKLPIESVRGIVGRTEVLGPSKIKVIEIAPIQ